MALWIALTEHHADSDPLFAMRADADVEIRRLLTARLGDPEAAIGAYRKSAALPDPPLAVSDRLAWLLVRHEAAIYESRQEAVAFAERASRARAHNSASALQTLSIAYANASRSLAARQAALRALALARADQDENLAGAIERHLLVLSETADR